MKTTSKLWAIGISSGVAAIAMFAFTLGAVVTADAPSSGGYSLAAALIVCLGVLSSSSCLVAVAIRVLQDDQAAVAHLREVRHRLSQPDNVRKLVP